MIDRVLRWPRRVARTGLFLCEGAVAGEPVSGARLRWIAENLMTLAGADAELVGRAPVGALVIPEAKLLSALAVLSRIEVDAIGPSLARLPGLGNAAVIEAWAAPRSPRRWLLSAEDGEVLTWIAAAAQPVTPVAIEAASATNDLEPPPGFLRAAAQPITHLRVRIDATELQARAA